MTGGRTTDDEPTNRFHLADPRDRRREYWGLARPRRSGHLAGVHRGPVRRRRSRAMTGQATPTPVSTSGSTDADSASAVLVALGLGALFVAVWPLLLMLTAGRALDPVALLAHVSGML